MQAKLKVGVLVLLMISLMVVMLPTVFAAGSPIITVGTATGNASDVVTVEITVSGFDTADTGFEAGQFKIIYDSTKVTAGTVAAGLVDPTVDTRTFGGAGGLEEILISFVADTSLPYTPPKNGVLCSIPFTIISGRSDLIIAQIVDENSHSLPYLQNTVSRDLDPAVVNGSVGTNESTGITADVNASVEGKTNSDGVIIKAYDVSVTDFATAGPIETVTVSNGKVTFETINAATDYIFVAKTPITLSRKVTGNLAALSNLLDFRGGSSLRLLAGDLNNDDIINGLDLSTFATNFNKSGMTASKGDLNGDGIINGLDLSTFASNFNKKGSTK